MAPKLVGLKLSTLHLLDEGLDPLSEKLVKAMALDIENRPSEKGVREVIIKLKAVPVAHNDGNIVNCNESKVTLTISSAFPKYQSREYTLDVSRAGLQFNRDLPTDLHQNAMFPVEEGVDD